MLSKDQSKLVDTNIPQQLPIQHHSQVRISAEIWGPKIWSAPILFGFLCGMIRYASFPDKPNIFWISCCILPLYPHYRWHPIFAGEVTPQLLFLISAFFHRWNLNYWLYPHMHQQLYHIISLYFGWFWILMGTGALRVLIHMDLSWSLAEFATFVAIASSEALGPLHLWRSPRIIHRYVTLCYNVCFKKATQLTISEGIGDRLHRFLFRRGSAPVSSTYLKTVSAWDRSRMGSNDFSTVALLCSFTFQTCFFPKA